MKKRLTMWTAFVGVALPLGLFVVPFSRYEMMSWVSSEPFYESRPCSYWVGRLQDEDPVIRKEAAFALGSIGNESEAGVLPLCVALKDDDDLVRINAALALFKIGPGAWEAVGPLSE